MEGIIKTTIFLGAVFTIGTVAAVKAAANETTNVEGPQYYLVKGAAGFGGHGGIMAFPNSEGHAVMPMGPSVQGGFPSPALRRPLLNNDQGEVLDQEKEKNEIIARQKQEIEGRGFPRE